MSRICFLLTLLACLLVGPAPAHADDVEPPPADTATTPSVEGTPPPPQEAKPPEPLRILLTGDSITQGFHGDYTWRYRLWQELARQGVASDLVGSRTKTFDTTGWEGATYADPRFDTDHFALAGTTLEQQTGWIGPEIARQRPGLVVLASGVNDIRHGASAAQTLQRFRSWVAEARAADPDIDVLVSPVLEARDATRPLLATTIAAYDAMLPAAIAELTTPESRLTLADTTQGWEVLTHTVENLHPSPTGERHIAQKVAESLHLLGYLPQAPSIYRNELWTRTSPVTVVPRVGSAVLRWDDHMITGVKIYSRRGGTTGTIAPGLYRGGTATRTHLVPGATYEFRVQLVRGRLSGPWGAPTRVRIPLPAKPAAPARVAISTGGVRWTAVSGATSYVVRIRQLGSSRISTRRVTSTYVLMRRVAAATVAASNAAGTSPARAGQRS